MQIALRFSEGSSNEVKPPADVLGFFQEQFRRANLIHKTILNFHIKKTRRLASLQGEDRGVVALILFS